MLWTILHEVVELLLIESEKRKPIKRAKVAEMDKREKMIQMIQLAARVVRQFRCASATEWRGDSKSLSANSESENDEIRCLTAARWSGLKTT